MAKWDLSQFSNDVCDDHLKAEWEEDQHNFWNGEGHVKFFVEQNVPGVVFEVDVIDYSGCVNGIEESIGIDYSLEEGFLVDPMDLREGVTYTIEGIKAIWSKGDGWTNDDDVDYYCAKLTAHMHIPTYVKQKLKNIWWRNVQSRFRK